MTGTASGRPCFFMFEHRKQPLLPRRVFYGRLARGAGVGAAIILVSLGLGMAGYHFLERMPWLDAFVNAAMILSGMGPVNPLQTSAGKFFAGCYALFSGIAFGQTGMMTTVAGSGLAGSHNPDHV